MRLLIALLFAAALTACSDDTNTGSNNTTPSNVVDIDSGDQVDTGDCTPGDPGCSTDPCANNNCRPDQECRVSNDLAFCVCPAGTSNDGDACVADTNCTETTCSGSGTCSESPTGPVCACDTGRIGQFCDQCDTANGYLDDGNGGCTTDPCDLLNCEGDQVCVATGTTAECQCPAGTHLEGDVCAADETCSPTSCAGNGNCTDGDGTVTCACDEGWAEPFCQDCDTAGGYHPDGAGGCTTDPCLPNPCTMANQTSCVSPDGLSFTCECNAGFHPDATGACVADEACDANSCSGNGTCDDSTKEVVCTCDTGYLGDACDTCDTANDYHPDGLGGCTNDPCLPNPCMDANKTQCASSATNYTCSCDPGFHPDGAGGCTDDPCVPNTCAATNQACRDNNGVAECYTPDCDDQNPCTNDVLTNGVCTNTPVVDGTSCSTTECTDNQVCTAGTCGGGAARNCDDTNPCTADTCDAITGCVNTADDALVPDDGVACTADTCSGGIAQNLPTNASCDDGAFCNGEEVCRPNDAAADAQGCVTQNVPVAPATGPCESTSCDEASDSFPIAPLSAGTACNDGVYCTTGDTCDAMGACVGTLDANCGATTCGSTTALGSNIDIPQAFLDIDVTIDGQPLPATHPDNTQFRLLAVAKDTGAEHYLTRWEYDYSTDVLEGPYDTNRLVPGLYDILYERYPGSRSTATNLAPYGRRMLMTDVVLTRGMNTLDVDVPITRLTLDVTIDGQPLPATHPDNTQFRLLAVARDTGAEHYLTRWEYDYSTDVLEGPYDTHFLIPGTYDILYERYPGSRSTATNLAPYGRRLLQTGVVISGASQTLNIDVPMTELTLNLTIDGQPLPATHPDNTQFRLLAVAHDTGAEHYLTRWEYDYSTDVLEGPYDTHFLIPGTYDILYERYPGSRSTATNLAPYGRRLLQTGVVISGASQTLNIDVPMTDLTLNVTVGGQPLPATHPDNTQFRLLAVARDTGAEHYLTRWEYDYSTDVLEGPYDTHFLVPGTYDILYERYPGSRSTATNLAPYGRRLLQTGVVISGASQTLNIDVPMTELTLNMTIAGQPLPATHPDNTQFRILAVAKDTGAEHYLTRWEYDYSTDVLEGPYDTHFLVPGTYDILYERYPGSRSTMSNLAPYGRRLLQSDVVISGASQTLAIDVPISVLSTTVTIDGQPLPATHPDNTQFRLLAVARDTGAEHYLTRWEYDYSTDVLEGPYWTYFLVPGTYDILYERYPGSRSTATNLGPYGRRYLGVCVDI